MAEITSSSVMTKYTDTTVAINIYCKETLRFYDALYSCVTAK
jgi:hypothetical protein